MMISPLSMFMRLPTPMKVGGGAAGGGMLFFFLYMFSGSAFLIILIGMVLVGLMLAAYAYILKRRKKRRAAPLERELMDNAGATPQGVSEPAQRALLDDLRKRFEKGVQVFRSLGKDLYSTPWFLIIGESGSGKTEAIRHCNLSFPANLTDPLQGAGGTMNMDWWFTSNAVILDTAGKMLFEDAKPGVNDRWRELLALLKRSRTNEPINGLILVLPSDNLINDSAEEIERKGARFAQQLDLIQRTLDVRFPVFVVVTKCDLINGFREFFYNLDDPKLQHQMLGWSNPDPLDELYNAALVGEHMTSVLTRLRRRRLALLQDALQSESSDEGRTELINALYAFPKSLELVVPRLQRYMEMIFVSSEWSAKPLFLRGIYFTSSMQEGSALDEELSEALGIAPDSLPEGGIWKRDRAYFLRDVFTEKIFREKKLITRASSTKQVHRKRNAIVMGAGFVGVALLLFLTWFGARSMTKSIGLERNYWMAGAFERNWENSYWKPIVARPFQGTSDYAYHGRDTVYFPKQIGKKDSTAGPLKNDKGNKVTIEAFHQDVLGQIEKGPIHVPWIFSFARVFNRRINTNRENGQRTLFEAGVLEPLIDVTRDTMMLEAEALDTPAGVAEENLRHDTMMDALVQLVRIEGDKLSDPLRRGSRVPLLELRPLLDYAVKAGEAEEVTENADEEEAAEPDTDAFESVLQRTYLRESSKGKWPPDLLNAGSEEARIAVTTGIKRFVRHWSGQVDQQVKGGRLSMLKDLSMALDKFGDFEERFIRGVGAKPPATTIEFKAWSGGFEDFKAAFEQVKALDPAAILQNGTLQEAALSVKQDILNNVDDQYGSLLYEELFAPLIPHLTELLADDAPLLKAMVEAKENEPRPGQEGYQALQENVKKALKDPDSEMGAHAVFLLALANDLIASWAKPRADLDKFLKIKHLQGLDEEFVGIVPEENLQKLKRVDKKLWERIQKDPRLYNIRYVMYSLANDLLEKAQAAPRIDGVRASFGAIHEDVAETQAKIGLLHGLDRKAYGFDKASGAAEIVATTALRSRNHKIFSKFLVAKAPQAPKDVAAIVGEISKELAPLRQPRIRMTNMGGGAFDLKYHPEGAGNALKGWNALLEELQKETVETLELERLRRQRQDVYNAYEGYAKDYADYWTKRVVPKIDSFDSWEAFLQVINRQEADAAALNGGLERFGKIMLKALNALKPHMPARSFEEEFGQLDESLSNLESQVFLRKCETICNNWRDLSDGASKARVKLLAEPLGEYWLSEGLDGGYVGDVWRNVASEGIRVMVRDYEKDVVDAIQKTRAGFNKVPLNRLVKDELTVAALADARRLVDNVGQCDPAQFKIRSEDPRIVLVKAASDECTTISKLKGVLDALPPKGRKFTCRISVANAKDISTQWRAMEVWQNGKRVGARIFFPGTGKSCQVEYPGDLVFKLFRHPTDDKPDKQKDVEGLWAPVRLLFEGKRMENGKQWKITLPWTDDKGNTHTGEFQLEFEKVFPELTDWPFAPRD